MDRVGWVLTGGGLTGVAGQTGALLALTASGLKPNYIVGLSAGSLVGGLFASGKTPGEIAFLLKRLAVEDYWDPLSRYRLWNEVLRRFRGQTGYVRGDLLREWLRRNLGVSRIEHCEIPFRPVAVNITRARQEAPHYGDLAKWIRASTAIPLIFRAEEIDGEHYWDGGIAGSVPLDTMVDAFGPTLDRILVVTTLSNLHGHNEATQRWLRKPWTPLRALGRALDAVRSNVKSENMESQGIPVEILQLPVDSLDLEDADGIPHVMQQAEEYTERWLQGKG